MNNDELKLKLCNYFDKSVIESIDLNNLKGKKDIFSEIYEHGFNKEERKDFAQFFTHKELVDFILDNIPIKEGMSILDPACGAGAFLSRAFFKTKRIHGVDIDKNALNLAKLNLELIDSKNKFNLVNNNTLKDCKLKNIFPEINQEGGFDVIVGNPPFQNLKKGIDFNLSEGLYSEVISGIANSATLMIAKSFEFLKDGGYLGFVLPKNIIRVESFSALRNFLISNSKIHHIFDIDHYFKDVRGDQIIIILQKTSDASSIKNHLVNIHIHKKGGDFALPYSYSIKQDLFNKYDFLPVFYDKKVFDLYDLFNEIENNISSTSVSIFRGLGISMNSGLIQDKNDKGTLIYRGDSIKRFGIKYPLYFSLDDLNGKQDSKVEKLANDKVILQNLCSKEGGIFATISNKNEFNLDTVTNIIPKDLNTKYIASILNSEIANFVMIFLVYLNSNFTMHTDQKYIGRVPVVIPSDEDMLLICNLFDKLSEIDDKYSDEFYSNFE